MANQNNFPENPAAYMMNTIEKQKDKVSRNTIYPTMNRLRWLDKTKAEREDPLIRDPFFEEIDRDVSPFVLPLPYDKRRQFFYEEIDRPPPVPEPKEGKRPLPKKKKPSSSGGAEKYKYNNRTYTVRTGPRGGKYIVCKNKKIYI